MKLKLPYRHWSRVVFFVLTMLYCLSLVGAGFAVFTYEKYLGNSSPVQTWLNENATSYSTDIYDILIAMQDVSIAFRDAVLDKSSDNAKAQLKGKIETFESVFSSFEPDTEIGRYVNSYDSAPEAMRTTKLFLNSINEWVDGPSPVADSIIFKAEGDALLAVWRLATESVQKEFQARDEMVRAINSGRMLAERALFIGIALFVFGLLALISVNWAIKKWMAAERERFERLEYLLATVGHDLRSPLQAIGTCAKLLRKTAVTTDSKMYADIIKDSSKQLARLVDDLVDLARHQELSFEPQAIELATWVKEMTARFKVEAGRKGLQFQLLVPSEEIPPILFDETRLTQCVGNLLSNAIRYTDAGTIKLTVHHTQNSADQGELFIQVSDTGPGIAEADRARIFIPFERASTKGRGVGLGLAIASGIVRAAHGQITLETQQGLGSTFSISLPVSYSQEPVVQRAKDAASMVETPPKKLERVLIVEDDPALRITFTKLVEDMGYVADQASDGQEGFSLAKEKQYHAIITDIQMNGWDGFKLGEECRAKLHPCPTLIAVTAFTKTLGNDSRASVFDKVLYKPINDELLFEALEALNPN